ncbi:MAG TPA: hypothetical protein VK668_07670 [Mucilaginibacter sp.]|nr:hypothetical protein [Mucilaginibacter sp.]
MKRIIFFLFMVIWVGCKPDSPKTKDEIADWSQLRITLEDRLEINLINHNSPDSSEVKQYLIGGFFSPPVKKVKVITQRFAFTQAEKDSIYLLVEDMIVHPVEAKNHCSEFVGKIEVNIEYGRQLSQSFAYTSMCDWYTLSDQTLKLRAILRRRIKAIDSI